MEQPLQTEQVATEEPLQARHVATEEAQNTLALPDPPHKGEPLWHILRSCSAQGCFGKVRKLLPARPRRHARPCCSSSKVTSASRTEACLILALFWISSKSFFHLFQPVLPLLVLRERPAAG